MPHHEHKVVLHDEHVCARQRPPHSVSMKMVRKHHDLPCNNLMVHRGCGSVAECEILVGPACVAQPARVIEQKRLRRIDGAIRGHKAVVHLRSADGGECGQDHVGHCLWLRDHDHVRSLDLVDRRLGALGHRAHNVCASRLVATTAQEANSSTSGRRRGLGIQLIRLAT